MSVYPRNKYDPFDPEWKDAEPVTRCSRCKISLASVDCEVRVGVSYKVTFHLCEKCVVPFTEAVKESLDGKWQMPPDPEPEGKRNIIVEE